MTRFMHFLFFSKKISPFMGIYLYVSDKGIVEFIGIFWSVHKHDIIHFNVTISLHGEVCSERTEEFESNLFNNFFMPNN